MLPEPRHNGNDQNLRVEIPAEELASTLLQAIQNSADFIATSNCAGEFTFVNDAMLKAIGCRREELVGKHFSTIFSPDNPAAVAEGISTGGLGSGWNGDCVLRRRDGTDFSVFLNVGPLRDQEGRVTGMFGISRDITERKQAELAVRREAAIVAFSEDAIIGKDMNSIITNWNRGAEKLFGYTADEMVGTSIMRLIPVERRDEENYILERIKRGESVEHFETLRQTKDGRLIDVSVTASPIKDAAGKSIGVSKVARDITQRKRVEGALQEREEQLRLYAEHIPAAVAMLDRNMNYLVVSRRWMEGYRLGDQSIIGRNHYEIFPEISQRWIQIHGRCLAGAVEKCDEDPFPRPDGTTVWLQWEVRPWHQADGSIGGIIIFSEDITERKLAQEQIAEQAALLDKARDAILVRNLEGKIVFWNKGAERIYGWTREEAIGRSADELLYASPKKSSELNALVISGGTWQGQMQHLTRDKREINIEARWTLIRDNDGRPKSVLAINTDITEKKKLEAQFMRAQRMESIGTLAGGIAHDLNNILTPIMLSIDVLKTKSQDSQAKKILDTIEVSAKRGADIVRQVLSFARGLEGERVEVQLKHLLKDLEKIIADTFPKDIRLHFSIPKETWTLLGDPTQVHQILLNLCVNARDAMPNGGGLTVSIENCVLDDQYAAMHIEAKAGRYVMISVTDSGTGIQRELLDKIFEPFFTTKGLSKGTGMGLSTVTAIVKSHGGFVNVYSEVGNGTTFRVYLPAMEISSDARKQAAAEASLPRGNGEMILVVDDEDSVLTITSQTLQAFGYRALTATDGADAVAVYVQHRNEIAVVLTDMMMPIMDGAATIQALSRINPAVKIIAASGLTANGGVGKASGSEIKHFLMKPYTAETLLKAMRAILDESQEL